MPIKKKVKFNDKKEFKRYDKETESDQSGDEPSNQSDDESSSKKVKHSLDSDEEDNTQKYEALNRDVFKDIGQEAKTGEFDDDIKLTPFNMKDELDEGDFDKEGYYHWKSKEKDDIKDAWLDNIDWANINSFKQSKATSKEQDSNKPKTSDAIEESDTSESDNESTYSKDDDENSQIEMFKKIIAYLNPRETILKAIKRLGNTTKASGGAGGSTLSASQRWLKKKNQPQTPSAEVSEKATADKEALEKLTGLANHFIDKGFYDIYEETFESLGKKIKDSETKSSGQNEEFDIFADEVEEKNLEASTSGQKVIILEDSIVKWVYKITNTEDAKLLGPLTSQQMLEMSEKGDFKDKGVWCRKVNDSSLTFYNSKRIDFDLYT